MAWPNWSTTSCCPVKPAWPNPTFDDVGWKHLTSACRLSLPPLRDLP